MSTQRGVPRTCLSPLEVVPQRRRSDRVDRPHPVDPPWGNTGQELSSRGDDEPQAPLGISVLMRVPGDLKT
eukprot:9546218-Alexandrium_andersonii.AAC.1